MDLNCPHFYYNDLTKLITHQIIDSLSSGKKHLEGYVKWEYPFALHEKHNYFYWTYSIHRSSKNIKDDWDIHAWSGLSETDEPGIEIGIILKKGIWAKNHGIDLPELSNVVAHEIHHLTQGEDFCEKKLDRLTSYDYFLLQCEKEAFHIGFRAQSDMSGKCIEQCMRGYLEPRFKSKELTKKQVDDIVNAWINVKWDSVKGK
jgi:hypothetical protein